MMTSAGLMALNTPENIVQREFTKRDMRFLSELEAAEMWGEGDEEESVWTVDGNTVSSFLDPGVKLAFFPFLDPV